MPTLKPLLFFSMAALLLAAWLFHRYHLKPYQTERFRLSAAPAAAEGYPMEVIEGRFITSDGKSFPVVSAFLEGDWGLSAIGYVGGDATQPAPDSLELRWFSYPEDKFYEGHWLLPQQRIHDLLKQGFWNNYTQQSENYTDLTLCILPKGVVVVWLAGGNQVLLGRYEGREIDFDFKRFNEAANRPRMIAQEQAEMPPAVQEQIRTHTLSTKQWDTYLKKYPWKLAFSQPLRIHDYGVYYFNAEKTNYPTTKSMVDYSRVLLEPSLKAVPTSLALYVDATYGRKRQIQVRAFDETETLAAFHTLHARNPGLPLTLYVDTDERVSKACVFLKNDREQVELGQAQVFLFDDY